jgi:hypothetical protein
MGGGAEPKSRPSRLAFHHRQCPHETETFVSKDSCLTEYYPEEIASRRFAHLGLSGFLQKPFTSYELRSVIDTALAMTDHLPV